MIPSRRPFVKADRGGIFSGRIAAAQRTVVGRPGALTNPAESAIIDLGIAQRQAVRLHSPKGGEADADHITYRGLYGDDYCEKQKPPLWQVTVSIRKFS